MHLPVPFFAPDEETDLDAWFCSDEPPWEDSTSLFESLEPLTILERMPSPHELLALEAQPEQIGRAHV